MAHLRERIRYPPPGHRNHLNPPSIVASTSGTNPAAGQRRGNPGTLAGGIGAWFSCSSQQYSNPPVFFDADPEVEEPPASSFVADSILHGFNLNETPEISEHAPFENQNAAPNGFADGPCSATSANGSNLVQEPDGEVCSQPEVPYVGMIFDNIEEAQKVYNAYAQKVGFGTHIANTKYSTARNAPPGTVLSRIFGCVHAGKPASEKKQNGSNSAVPPSEINEEVDMSIHSAQKSRSKHAVEHMDMSDTRARKKLIRYDCKARMLVGMRNRVWTVTVFEPEHTHKMEQSGRCRYYRSHRKVPEEDYQLLRTLHDQNITTAKIMGCLGSVHGGDPRNLGYVKRDVSNIRTILRNEETERDMEMTMEYFKQRHNENKNFFYATQTDGSNAVRSLFWVDGRTRSLYHKYKDCIFFDTTFCTNRYNMPFAPLVGLNNHTHTVVLGCALLPDETTETFKWVFEQWMIAMGGQHPDNIMTDQEQAIGNAISEVFPDSTHRNCLYHILHLARKKLGPNLVEGHPFAEAFYACIYGTDTKEQFEACWEHMIQVFEMRENKHLQNMWKTRTKWAPVYFRNRFFPFTSTTGRSEGPNSYFKTLINPGDSVYKFVQQYELCQTLMLDREDAAGFSMDTSKVALWGSYSIEKQGQDYYTQEIFERFQKLVAASTKFYPVRAEADGLCFELFPNPGLELRKHRVRVELEEGLFSCSCNMFEMCGLICPHIIRVMVHYNVQQIPERYLLKRWSAAATTPTPQPGSNGIRFGIPPTNTLKYNALCRKLNHLASDACFADDTYEVVSKMADEASKLVATMTRARQNVHEVEEGFIEANVDDNTGDGMQQNVEGQWGENQNMPPHNSTVRNPKRVKPKGRPTEKVKRRKTLLEVRDEQREKRKKANEKKEK